MEKLMVEKAGTYCRECHPEYFPTDLSQPRQHDGHVAVAFGDHVRPDLRIEFKGADVTKRCIEARSGYASTVAGIDGFYVSQDVYMCECGKGPALEFHTGPTQVFEGDRKL